MKYLLIILLSFGFFATDSIAQKKVKQGQSPSSKKGKIRYGTASYYAKKFNKRKTASGTLYNPNKYTAACNVLPLRTWIRVTNMRNKRSVIVRVTDRLHRKNKRLVDLSWVAAKQLGYISRGLARVKVEVLPNHLPGK